MSFKSARQQLDEFLAPYPSWVQNLLYWDDSLSQDEQLTFSRGPDEGWPLERISEVRPACENILRKDPKKWQQYLKREKRVLLSLTPRRRPGAPGKDDIAREAALLRQRGKNNPQIATELKEQGIETTSEAIRKLLKRRAKPDKI